MNEYFKMYAFSTIMSYFKRTLLHISIFSCKQSTSHSFRSTTKIESVLKHTVDSGSKHQGWGKGLGFTVKQSGVSLQNV